MRHPALVGKHRRPMTPLEQARDYLARRRIPTGRRRVPVTPTEAQRRAAAAYAVGQARRTQAVTR